MRAVIVGGTGLIGSLLIQEVLADARYKELISVGRRTQSPTVKKWQERIGSMNDVESLCHGIEADVGFCCLGTTIGKAGSQEAFAEVDLHLPLRFARSLLQKGVKQFHVVSSLGADARSKTFYLRTKGQLEEGLKAIGFEQLVIYRPALLLGDRTEKRPFEGLTAGVYQVLKPIFPGFLKSWEPIEASTVARRMALEVFSPNKGSRVVDNRAMHAPL